MELLDYETNLNNAKKRTLQNKIEPDSLNIYTKNTKKILNSVLIEEIKKHINIDENKNLLLSSNANCISFNERYLSKICEVVIDKNKINCNLNITIGNIYKNGKILFGSDETHYINKLTHLSF